MSTTKTLKIDGAALVHVKAFRQITDEANEEATALLQEYEEKRQRIVNRLNSEAKRHLQGVCRSLGLPADAIWDGQYYIDTTYIEHDFAAVIERQQQPSPQQQQSALAGMAAASGSIN